MKLQKMPYDNTCLATAFAMCINLPAMQMIEELGVSWNEVWWPESRPPIRGWHIEEIQDVCLSHGYAVTIFSFNPHLQNEENLKPVPTRIWNHIHSVGVFIGETHAVAWDGCKIYNPSGMIERLNLFEIGKRFNLFCVVNPYYMGKINSKTKGKL